MPDCSLPPQLPSFWDDAGCVFTPGKVFYFSHLKNSYFHKKHLSRTPTHSKKMESDPETLGFSFQLLTGEIFKKKKKPCFNKIINCFGGHVVELLNGREHGGRKIFTFSTRKIIPL